MQQPGSFGKYQSVKGITSDFSSLNFLNQFFFNSVVVDSD